MRLVVSYYSLKKIRIQIVIDERITSKLRQAINDTDHVLCRAKILTDRCNWISRVILCRILYFKKHGKLTVTGWKCPCVTLVRSCSIFFSLFPHNYRGTHERLFTSLIFVYFEPFEGNSVVGEKFKHSTSTKISLVAFGWLFYCDDADVSRP